MKRLFIFLLTLSLLLPAIPVSATGEIPVFLNNSRLKFDVPPHFSDGRVSVPIREISETLGAEVLWNAEVKGAVIKTDTVSVIFVIGEEKMLVDNKYVELDAPASIINNRTFVPVRALCEALGLEVWWNSSENSVHLSTPLSFGDGHLISPTYYVASGAPEGCVLACKTMALSNHFDTPFTFDEVLALNNNTVYTYWGPQYSMDVEWKVLLLSGTEISPSKKMSLIMSEIENSSGIIAQFSDGVKYHGVVITGYTADGELIVCDPDTKSGNPENTVVADSCLAKMFGCYTTRELLPYLYAMRKVAN